MENFLLVEKHKIADWTAPIADINAVLEYLYGYILLILDCIRNQHDQLRLPNTRKTDPRIHLCLSPIIVMLELLLPSFDDFSEWIALLSGIPLYKINSNTPPVQISEPNTLAFPPVLLKFTLPCLRKVQHSYTWWANGCKLEPRGVQRAELGRVGSKFKWARSGWVMSTLNGLGWKSPFKLDPLWSVY